MVSQYSSDAMTSGEQDVVAFQQLEDYDWKSDREFQSGLQAILGSNPSPEQAEHLTLRARCFYLARKSNTSIDYNAYQIWRARLSPSLANGMSITASASDSSEMNNNPPGSSLTSRDGTGNSRSKVEPPAPYPISFSQIVELITSGEPIPDIKEVPAIVLDGQISQPTTAKRRKPWETGDDADVK